MGSEGGDGSRETLGLDLPSGLERAATPPGVRSIITIPGVGTEAPGSPYRSPEACGDGDGDELRCRARLRREVENGEKF
jgi:hypothetical protein